RVLVPACKNESPIDAQLGDRDKTELVLLELARAVMVFGADRDQLAVIAVRPAVIGAAQEAHVLAIGAAYPHAAVTARIEKDAHHAVVVAHQDGWIDAAGPAQHVARIGNFALVADEEPAAPEDAIDFHAKDFGIGEDAARDQAFLRADDRFEMLAVGELREIVGLVIAGKSEIGGGEGHGQLRVVLSRVLPFCGSSASFNMLTMLAAACSAAAGSPSAIALISAA